ncbi:MAG: hypothetical protein BWY85_00929 [Firmicutes bacterium ADurb.Bin506]|nr:MAG: hypothetical protein BWY85_00929 [Firmicutes bacterium ADurb.Bin506]
MATRDLPSSPSPSARATRTAPAAIPTSCCRSGVITMPTSAMATSLPSAGMSYTPTWHSTPPAEIPVSLFRTARMKSAVCTKPFIRMSAPPLLTVSTALRHAAASPPPAPCPDSTTTNRAGSSPARSTAATVSAPPACFAMQSAPPDTMPSAAAIATACSTAGSSAPATAMRSPRGAAARTCSKLFTLSTPHSTRLHSALPYS